MKGLDFAKTTLVGTMAVCLLGQNLMKIAVFGSLGFNPLPWLPVVLAMMVTGFVGTWLGALLLGRLYEHRFRLLLKWAMKLIAVTLLVETLI
ncbi:hypothetical protein DV711_11605 [Motiliproteus coralliicola]|uniref:Membrane transporter protein n=2 Tax=Motiliproteus coralliicola TaxID=2283196 RepID=A0A369WEE9_9GAMM|nr:hypothetical protein DV711_11605 [Motiliproteus coralliicola]